MEEVIFSEVTAKVAIDFVNVVSATIEQHENIFFDIGLRSGAKCIQENTSGTWILHGDLDSINHAYNLMSTIYNLSQLDVMSSDVRAGAPGTPSFNHSNEYMDVVRFAANTPIVPSLRDDTDDIRFSDETSLAGEPPLSNEVTASVSEYASDQDGLRLNSNSTNEPAACQFTGDSDDVVEDVCKSRRKRGLPRKAITSRAPRKVTLLLSAKELGCEQRTLRTRKHLAMASTEDKESISTESSKTFRPKTLKKRRDSKKKRHIEDVIKKINRSKMRACGGNHATVLNSAYRNSTEKASTSENGRQPKGEDHQEQLDISTSQRNFRLICSDCGKIFSSVSNLYRHQKVSHGGMRYSCPRCGKKFTCYVSLQRHERIVHESLRCDTCQEIFASQSQKEHHQCPGTSREKSVQCHVCGSNFSCTSNLNKHIRLQHAVDSHACKLCAMRFGSAEELANHTRVAHLVCLLCKNEIGSDTSVEEHLAICSSSSLHGERSTLKGKMDRKSRKEAHWPKSRQPIKCTHCDKVFSNSSNVRKHVRIVHNNVRFECHFCAKAYACKEQLSQHIVKVHQGVMYRCDLCQEEFKNRLYLAKHQKLIHNHLVVESSYQCEQCGKTFLYKNNLQRHRKQDHEGVNYDCRICGHHLKSLQQAKEHDLVKHQGKTFCCLHCHKKFSSCYKLKEHETSMHTSLRPHRCAVCGEQFGRHSALSYHLQKKHERRVNIAGELMPVLSPNKAHMSGSSETCAMPIPINEVPSVHAERDSSTFPSIAKIEPESRPGSSGSSNAPVLQETSASLMESVPPLSIAIPNGLHSPPSSLSIPKITDEHFCVSSISADSFRLTNPVMIIDQNPVMIIDMNQPGHLVNSTPTNQGPVHLRTATTETLPFRPTDVDNSQNPFLALTEGFSFYDSFSYSPLAQHHAQDISFFNPSSSTY